MSTTLTASDEWIGATVKGVAGLKGIALKRIALALGIKPPALSNKLHGRAAWSAIEVAKTAETLGVEVGELYNGYNGLVPFPRSVAEDGDNPDTTSEECPVRRVTDLVAA